MEKCAHIKCHNEIAMVTVNKIQLTANSTTDDGAQTSDTKVVWQGTGGSSPSTSDSEIFYYNSTSTTQLTNNNNTYDAIPQISGNNVAWEGTGVAGDTESEIFY